MTKASLKEMYKEWTGKVCEAHYNDNTLEELKDLCEKYGDGHRWCSWQKCLEEIIKGGNNSAITRAFMVYDRHMKIDTEHDVWIEVASKTNNFTI